MRAALIVALLGCLAVFVSFVLLLIEAVPS
jgi:hypothetical protein